jgi:hypothetical protein
MAMGKGGQIGACILADKLSRRFADAKTTDRPMDSGASVDNRKASNHSFYRNGIRVGKYADRYAACITQSAVLQAQNITRTFKGGPLGKFGLNGANDRHRRRFMECRKVCCATDELGKLWNVEYELTKVDPIEKETSEIEDRVDLQGRTSPCSVRARSRRFRFNRDLSLARLVKQVAKIPKHSLHRDSRGSGGGGGRGPSRQIHYLW